MHLTDAELDEFLCDPLREDERTEPLAFVVTADGSEVSAEARARLASLPCVVIGDGHDPDRPPAHVDVVAEAGVAGVGELLATVASAPTAATSLALLLRAGPWRDVGAGLVAESATYSALQAGPEFARWRQSRPVRRREAEVGPTVLVDRRGPRLELVLNRPQVRNALNRVMRDELLGAFQLAAVDTSITEVVVRGAGPCFCSGGDLDEFGSREDPASAHLVRLAANVGRAVAAVAERVTFHLHGACAGSGIELAGFAGTVVADPATTLTLPEVGLGLVPGAGGTVSLVRRAGRHRVLLLALAGRPVDAERARRWGLVDRVA